MPYSFTNHYNFASFTKNAYRHDATYSDNHRRTIPNTSTYFNFLTYAIHNHNRADLPS